MNIANVMQQRRRRKQKGQFYAIWRRFKKSKTAIMGLAILCIILFSMFFANFIAPYNLVVEQKTESRLQPPSIDHWFGTDGYGRDIFARIVHGTKYSLSMGVIAVGIGTLVGGIFGAIGGYYGGKIDSLIMRLLDVLLAIPTMLLALAIVAALGAGYKNVLVALTVTMIPYSARIIRSALLTVVEQDFIEAAKACGSSNLSIIFKHVLPNAIGTVIVQATIRIGIVIITAAALSFLGMGVQPPMPEWGAMLSESKNFMLVLPHTVLCPGLAITITSLSLNLIGDGLRDALDPKLKD